MNDRINDVATWERRFQRERAARREAEEILERKSVELYQTNQWLQAAREDLEIKVMERTEALEQAVSTLRKEIERRRSAEQELRVARDSAIELSDLKSDFLARMSHEMRTPLNAIIGITGLMLDSELDITSRERLGTVRSSSRMLLRLINDILDLTKIDAGKLDLDFGEVHLENTIEQCLSLVMIEAEEQGLDFELSKPVGLPAQVIADGGRLQQLLLNLLTNAVKYSGGTKVRIGMKVEPAPDDVRMPAAYADCALSKGADIGRLVITVADDGKGIAKGDFDSLFDPFSQLDGPSVGSSGLGLTICQKICQAMGGDVSVDSEPGKGAEFHVSMLCGIRSVSGQEARKETPVKEGSTMLSSTVETGAWLLSGHMDADALAERSTMAERMPLSILLADDYEVNRMVQHAQLEQLGYRADAVANGEEVLRALHARAYDVVLMDIRMPVMDGVEATRRIRGRVDGPQPYIVAMTASALAEDRRAFTKSGMDGYLPKPVEMPALIEVLEAAHGQRQARSTPTPFSQDDMIEMSPVELDLDGLRSRLGPALDAVLQKVIPVFLRELPGRRSGIAAAVAAEDAAQFAQLCHGLKGASRSIGAVDLAGQCDEFERLGRDGVIPARSDVDALLDLAERTRKALERQLQVLRPVSTTGTLN